MLRLHRKTAANQSLKLKVAAIKIMIVMTKKMKIPHVMTIVVLSV